MEKKLRLSTIVEQEFEKSWKPSPGIAEYIVFVSNKGEVGIAPSNCPELFEGQTIVDRKATIDLAQACATEYKKQLKLLNATKNNFK